MAHNAKEQTMNPVTAVHSAVSAACKDAFQRQMRDAARGIVEAYPVWVRPAYGPGEIAAPYFGMEAPSPAWSRMEGVEFSPFKSEAQNYNTLRDAAMHWPLFAL
jgi:hypothetical protein